MAFNYIRTDGHEVSYDQGGVAIKDVDTECQIELSAREWEDVLTAVRILSEQDIQEGGE